jgi:hypothetical protein
MADQWYYARNNQKHGPLTGRQLKQAAATGQLQPTDMVWKEGMPKWVPASGVKGLFPMPQAAAAGVPKGDQPRQTRAGDPAPAPDGVVPSAPVTEPPRRPFRLPRKTAWVLAAAGAGVCVLGVCVVGMVALGLSWFGGSRAGSSGKEATKPGVQQTQGGGGRGYTQRVLDADPKTFARPNVQSHRPYLKGVVAKHEPGTVADLLQAIGLLSETDYGIDRPGVLKGVRSSENGNAYVSGCGLVCTPQFWTGLFGPPQGVHTIKGKFTNEGWTIKCSDGEVRFAGVIRQSPVVVSAVLWDNYVKEYCVSK